MARITDGVLPSGMDPYMTLDRYQEIMHLPIAAFNGLNKVGEEPVYDCSTIWKQSERDYVAQALAEAEEMREQELTYPLSPKYYIGLYDYARPLVLNHKFLVKIGERKSTDVSIGAALTLRTAGVINEPVVLTIATALTDATEIKVYYPGESVEIHPSSVAIAGGVLTIRIPRSRLVDPTLNDNREDHLYYDDDANFITSVDVKRVYYDTATGTEYVWDGTECSGLWPSTQLVESTQSAYHRILDIRIAEIETVPANYSGGIWTVAPLSKSRLPRWIRVRYVAGKQASAVVEKLTVRLSHTLMPNKPVSCPTVHMYWQDDNYVDENSIMTPYGNKRGAIDAWLMDSRQKVGSGGMFPRVRPTGMV